MVEFLVSLLFFIYPILDEDDNLNNGPASQDAGKALVATLGSIEVPEDSPILTKAESKIPVIQMGSNSDADFSADDEFSLPLNRYKCYTCLRLSICTY